MRRFISIICVILVAAMLLPTAAFAAESANARSSSYFWCSTFYLYKTSSTTFRVYYEVGATGIMQELGVNSIRVQRSSDGETWTTMKTYKKADYPEFICENTGSHSGYVTYTGTAGYYYRAVIVFYAKNSAGFGEVTEYTSSLKL